MEDSTKAQTQEKDASREATSPLPKGQPLTLEESIERMYERYGRTFEALSK